MISEILTKLEGQTLFKCVLLLVILSLNLVQMFKIGKLVLKVKSSKVINNVLY